MLLLTLHQWYATREAPHARRLSNITERTMAMATTLPLGEALERIVQYQAAHKEKYTKTSLEFRLLSVSEIPDETPLPVLRDLGVDIVENLMEALAN